MEVFGKLQWLLFRNQFSPFLSVSVFFLKLLISLNSKELENNLQIRRLLKALCCMIQLKHIIV